MVAAFESQPDPDDVQAESMNEAVGASHQPIADVGTEEEVGAEHDCWSHARLEGCCLRESLFKIR